MQKVLIALLCVALVFGAAYLILSYANDVNYRNMLEYIDTFAPVSGEGDVISPLTDEYGNTYFVSDGEFKILQITDVHLGGGVFYADSDRKALNAVAAMIGAERPDLVIVTGDMCSTYPMAGTFDNSYGHEYFIRLMERLGVYWTVTFGNHDNEPYNIYDRAYVSDMYANEELKYCLYKRSPDGVSGEGNHIINVKNSAGEVTQSLVMLDSHAYVGDNIIDSLAWNYDCIKEDQIRWYTEMTELYSPRSSLLFFHIPLTEVKDAYLEYIENGRNVTENVTYFDGHDGEEDGAVCCPDTEEELFETLLSLCEKNDMSGAMFFGHDHFNNYVMEYKGITLSYGYSVDYMAYGDIGSKGYQRGCTVINASADGGFEIIHENYYQDKYQPLYEKEKVDMYPYFDK